VLAINPNMPAALTNRCLYLAKQGNFDAGRKDCDQAEKLGADNPDIIVSIGAAYYLAKRYEDAVRYYNHALQLSPNHPFALYSRGIAEAKLGQDEQSKADLSEAARIMPNVGAIMESAGMK
jgi:tetratricopeptide (TPR) repeat protein